MENLAHWLAAMAAMTTFAAQPATAAQDIRDHDDRIHRTAAFAGASLRLPFDAAGRAKPTARLQAGFAHSYSGGRTASPTVYRHNATFAFGASEQGVPSLYFGNRDAKEFGNKLGVNTGTTLLIIGGVALAVVAIAFAAGDNDGAAAGFED